ncbi:MAG TPA: trehalose-phosphatase [Acidimicrobiales bacterium]|nr:trehalose-phosphatase [Acidimicrobiales bacterium]
MAGAAGGASGLGALGALAEDPAASALLTDFDGTLAAIVPDPATAVPVPGAIDVLARLARHLGVVGVVSGRPAAFLRERLAGAGGAVHLVGVYGFEWFEDGELRIAPEVEPWLGPAARVVAAARAEAPAGVGVEHKGAAVAIHWRRAPEAGAWGMAFARRWAADSGLELQPGRMAVELRPPVRIDKGVVVTRLSSGCRAVGFAGDDAGDLAAFAALDDLARHGVLTARVAVADEESPAALLDAADVVVEGPVQAIGLLRRLADVVEARPAAGG